MTLYRNYNNLKLAHNLRRVVTIGNFDGVHLGHQAVISRAQYLAKNAGFELVVLTFDPHPMDFLKPLGPRLRLVSPKQKYELLKNCGADIILAQHFNDDFATLSAKAFARDVLHGALNAAIVIVGQNFTFGRGRHGDLTLLKQLGDTLGFEVHGEALIQSNKLDISSSQIRSCLLQGDTSKAAAMLGRPHEITGKVRHGKKAGRKLGFPTINLEEVNVLAPGPGIYAAECIIGEQTVSAAAYIGTRPTLGYGATIEAHLLNFDENIYDRTVTLKFYDRLRGDIKFKNTKDLTTQMTADVAKIKELLGAIHDRQ